MRDAFSPKSRLKRAWMAYFSGQYVAAIEIFKAVIVAQEAAIFEAQARLGLAMCWEDVGLYAHARAAYQTMIELFPDSGLRDAAQQGITRCARPYEIMVNGVPARPLRAPLEDFNLN